MKTLESTEIEILIEGKVVKSNLDTFCAEIERIEAELKGSE